MSTIHIATPAAPRTAACGAADAARFTPWRWKSTCPTCKMATAARAFDAPRKANVAYRADIPIRYSALVAHVRAAAMPNAEAALAEFEAERLAAARCPKHGLIADPIALFEVVENRMVFGCPDCTDGAARARWEAEGSG